MPPMERQHLTLLQGLQALLGDSAFTDVQLSLKDGQVLAVRPLLAAISPVFRAMLSTDMVEGNSHTVHLPTVTCTAWDCILHFYFDTRTDISAELLPELVEIAEMYELLDLKNHCEKALPSIVTVDNCLFLNRVAVKFELGVARRKLRHFLAENFMKVAEQEEMMELTAGELLELVRNPATVTTEDQVCQTILAWVTHNSSLPTHTLRHMLAQVRLQELSRDYVANCLTKEVLSSEHNSSLLTEFFGNGHLLHVQFKPTPVPCRRGLIGFCEALIILGHDETKAWVHAFSQDAMTWTELSSPGALVNDGFAAVQVQDVLVVTGGENRNRATYFFETKTQLWSRGPDLLGGRQDHGMAVINNVVYAVGGFTVEALASIEEFALSRRGWRSTGSLLVATDECGVGAVGEKIVVVGGREDACRDLIQVFDVETGSPSVLKRQVEAPMLHVRAVSLGDVACFLSSHGEMLLVTESEEGKEAVQVVRQVRLDTYGERRRFGLSFDGYSIGVFGGLQEGQPTCSVEFFGFNGKRHAISGFLPLPKELRVYGIFTMPLSQDSMENRASLDPLQ